MTTDTLLTEAAEAVMHGSDEVAMWAARFLGAARQLREREAKAEGLDAALADAAVGLIGFCEGVFGVMVMEDAKRWRSTMESFRNYQGRIDAALATKPGDGESR